MLSLYIGTIPMQGMHILDLLKKATKRLLRYVRRPRVATSPVFRASELCPEILPERKC